MLYYIGQWLSDVWGPARLFQSYGLLIVAALYLGFFLVWKLLPKLYKFLPTDRGREYTLTAEAAKGKPTGSGVIFITIFVVLCLFLIPMNLQQGGVLLLTWLMMLTGYLDDRSQKGWGEYRKAVLDFILGCGRLSFGIYDRKGFPGRKDLFLVPVRKGSCSRCSMGLYNSHHYFALGVREYDQLHRRR